MKLHSLRIEGLRRIKNATVVFGDASFLIGTNNTGKSTVLLGLEKLLSVDKRLDEKDYYSTLDPDTGETKSACNKVVLEAEFRNLPIEARTWRGFKGRTFSYDPSDTGETGISIFYRKTYELGKDVIIELKTKRRRINPQYQYCNTPQDYINAGIDEKIIKDIFDDVNTKITGKSKSLLEQIDDIWILEEEEEWFQNPGGIPQNVLSRLPRYIIIPAESAMNQLEGSGSGVLNKMLMELFEDVRKASTNYTQAQTYLDALAKELDPGDTNSEFGKMIKELNDILKSVFPESKLHATTDLSNPDKVLRPTFNVEMSSNIRTTLSRQGTGMIRAAAFGILRYRQKWISNREDKEPRSVIVAFEEPEMYLHPSAANQMRNTIYDLSYRESQIIATTHSPYMIDLSRKPKQVLNRFSIIEDVISVVPFNVTDAFKTLQNEDKEYVKMILKIDDYIARIFFTNNVVVVEGDTEDIVIRETIRRMPIDYQIKILTDFEIIKARGKAAIIGLTKYMIAMGVKPVVVHDRDKGIEGAEIFNEPIKGAVGDNGKIIVLEECIEDILGYEAPKNEKPYKAYKHVQGWGEAWLDVPSQWRDKIKQIFSGYVPD